MLHDITPMKTDISKTGISKTDISKTGTSHSHHHQNPVTGHEGPQKEQRYSPTLSLTFLLDGCGWSMPHPSRCTPGKETQYPCTGGWVGCRACPHPTRVWTPDRPFCSESLHCKSWVIKQNHFKCGNYVVSNRMVKFKGKLVSVYAIQWAG